METRDAKLQLARQKLKSHQDRKVGSTSIQEADNLVPRNNMIDIIKDNYVPVQHTALNSIVSNPEIETKSSNQIDIVTILELQKQNTQLLETINCLSNENNSLHQKSKSTEYEINALKKDFSILTEDLHKKELYINELEKASNLVKVEKSVLEDELEFTKSVLTAKDTEISSLNSKIDQLEKQIEITELHLNQLNSGAPSDNERLSEKHENETLLHKISLMEAQLKSVKKERDHINTNYEQYVNELNDHLKSANLLIQKLSTENQSLSIRVSSLIDQISSMEIRLQNFNNYQYNNNSTDLNEITKKTDLDVEELQRRSALIEEEYKALIVKNEETTRKLIDSEIKIQQLQENMKKATIENENISLAKLNSDITSDKIAAQRASEQNKKLKLELERLEKDFVKLTQDKLELTEKISAEKYLNRELTIKLAEVEDKAKALQLKLTAKDEEMIRLQNNYRELAAKNREQNEDSIKKPETGLDKEAIDASPQDRYKKFVNSHQHDTQLAHGDAMVKLQDRFLNIMNEIANLSDEKQQLEHIILQLQNETDTICEYVALYQQQRSLLKKRDEERCAQINIFQKECEALKKHIHELNSIFIKLTEDKELSNLLQNELRHKDIVQALKLLQNLQDNTLVSSNLHISELKNLYPCACCSGNVIDI